MSSEFAQGPPWPPEAAAAVLCHLTVVWNGRLGYHDAPDPGIRRVSGILGILATGFASNGAKGLLSENPAQLGIQARHGARGSSLCVCRTSTRITHARAKLWRVVTLTR
jgi:hypothetical protein